MSVIIISPLVSYLTLTTTFFQKKRGQTMWLSTSKKGGILESLYNIDFQFFYFLYSVFEVLIMMI